MVTFQARVWRELYDRWLSATESRSSTSSPGESSCCCSWHPIVTPRAFVAHSGSNLLPEPGVILDAGSLVAMVVKEVAVISAPLFGGVMTVVQLVSVTAAWCNTKKVCALCCCKNNYKYKLPMLVL